MIHEIAPHVYNNCFSKAEPKPDSIVIFIKNRSVLADKTSGEIRYPLYSELTKTDGEFIHLFSVDDTDYFFGEEGCAPVDGSYEYLPAGVLMWSKPKQLAFAGIVGCQLSDWYLNNKFCGRCGKPMERDSKERMLRCPSCGNTLYPKICPAVIVACYNGDKLLLTKYAGRGIGAYALIAGFAEIGEPIEETVRREVFEETGIKVKNLRFYKSQPWPLSDSLLMGFWCELDGSDEITVDTNELSVAEWVSRPDIPYREVDISLTGEMINYFKDYGAPK
ncbi:MAG: NAD(+) diphosphatase [Papillibacter sp.]|nr:NAD(+) diphosphatase [Papillibacter sp.]